MIVESRRVIHIGLNYVIGPKKPLTVDEKLQFQKELSMIGLEADNTAKKEGGIGIKSRYEGSTVIVETSMTSANAGQLLILMPDNPNTSLYPQIADAVGAIYSKVFTDPKPQAFPSRDGCVRKLYSCGPDYPHAFKYIWENMLGKTQADLSPLGGSIAGGGLRFVVPAVAEKPVETEVRIESLLKDPTQLWVEARMKWLQPDKFENGFKAGELFKQINDFIDENVTSFMLG
jgi:hypothetical protein